MFTLDVARVHVRDLHRAAERSHQRHDARQRPTSLRRLVARARHSR